MNCEKKDCLLQRKPGSLLPGDWLPRLQTRWAGRGQVRYASAMDSTNRVLADMARQGAAAGSMAICEVQRQGRGRLNRRWDSPEGEGLLQSLLLHPRLPAERAQLCTLAAAVAMAQAIEDAAPGLGAGIKWPNDLVLGGRKCAGILCETVADGDGLRYIVMGAGVNVSQRIFKGELREKATSLWIAARAGTPGLLPPRTDAPKPLPVSARSVSESCPGEGDHKRPPCGFPDRQTLLLAYLLRMEAAVEAVELAGLDGILAEYARRSVTLGGRVRVEEAGKAFTGIAEGLDETGALLVRETAGSPRDGSQDGPEPAGFDERAAPRPHAKGAAGPGLRRVLSGDVSVRGVMGYVETKV